MQFLNKSNFIKTIAIIFCVGFLFSGFVNSASAATTYFVDNTLTTGTGDGLSWPNAFHSIANLLAVMGGATYDTVYIKATGVPYREPLNSGQFTNKTVYGDAVGGTGTETTRGSLRSEFYASADTSSFTWAQEGSSNVYRYDGPFEIYSGYSESLNTNEAVAWYHTSSTTVITLKGSGYACPSTITNLSSNAVCYNIDTKKLWVNIGTNPTGKHIEILQRSHPLEIWIGEKLYGVVGKYGKFGIFNGGCSNWVIEDSEFAYNDRGASNTATDPNTSSYFRNNILHDNYIAGIYLPSGDLRNEHYQNNLVYNNGSSYMWGTYGIYIAAKSFGATMNFLENNTVYGNTGYGIYVEHGWNGPSYWTIKNNIVFGNTKQVYLEDNATINFTASNNIVSPTNSYYGVWEANKGAGSSEADPLLVSTTDFRLQSSSPAIDTGTDLGITTDFLGTARPRGLATDIGAYEYDAASPVISSASINSETNATPDFTFTSDEAGTISYSGDCTSSNTTAIAGSTTITLTALSEGTHSNCKVTVTDPAGNISNQLDIPSFTVDATPPTNVGITTISVNSATQVTVVAESALDAGFGLAPAPYWFTETSGNPGANSSTDWQTSNRFPDTDLSSDYQYTYKIKVKDKVGNVSSYSTEVSKTPYAVAGGSSYSAPSTTPPTTPAPTTTTTTSTPEPTTTETPAPTITETPTPPATTQTLTDQQRTVLISQIKEQLVTLLTQLIQMLTAQASQMVK